VSTREYELRCTYTRYDGAATNVTVEVFRAVGEGKQFSIEQLTFYLNHGVVGDYILERHLGVIVIPQLVPIFSSSFVSNIPGPFHFNGTLNGDEYMTIRPFAANTYTTLVTAANYSEE
jgi:hypothetical protein